MSKFRLDLVTNSSSSSYTCEVCGSTESGMDMCLSDAGTSRCVNGHEFCDYHMESESDKSKILEELIKEKIVELSKSSWRTEKQKEEDIKEETELLEKLISKQLDEDEIDEYINDTYDYRYNVPVSSCPICSFGSLRDNDVVAYLYKKAGLSEEQLKKEIKELFKSYDEFKAFMK